MGGWNYVVTAHKPTNVTHSCVGSFTNPPDLNLIIGKCTRLEIHLLTALGLQLMFDVPVYGRIATLELFHSPGESKELLFLAFERDDFCVLQWDAEAGALVTLAVGDLANECHQPPDNEQNGIIDPDCRLIGLHSYDGKFKVIPIGSKGQLKEASNISLKELQVLDIKFLYGCSKPTIALLYQDNKDTRHLKTYEVQVEEFIEGTWFQNNLDNGAGLLIPIPLPLGGVIIIGEQTICYCNASAAFVEIPIQLSITKAYGMMGAHGSRYLLSDYDGILYCLILTQVRDSVFCLELEFLGETSAASTLTYLGNDIVYVGSSCGDSQLIKLKPQADSKGSHVEVLETFLNLAPIIDMCVVDLEHQGQAQVITCSGAFKDGSLRIVRNGIAIHEQASVELQGMKGIWSLQASSHDKFDSFLVVSFITETRILAINADDELEETKIDGFDSKAETLFCCTAIHEQLVQITAGSIRLVDANTRRHLTEWIAPNPLVSINVATANSSQILVASGGGNLIYFEIGQGLLMETKRTKLDYEIACLDINPIGENHIGSNLVAVGVWTDVSIHVYALPSLTLVAKESLGGEIIPRSVLFCSFEGIAYLLCALGDGHLFNFKLDISTGALSDRKKISLGTQPIMLQTFWTEKGMHVFAASDRSTVIHSSNKKLVYSNVNLKEVNHICPFNSSSFPESLAICKKGELIIGKFDDIQKLHIRTVPLGEQPRRISHQEKSHTFAICSAKYSCSSDMEIHYVHLISDQTFKIMSSYELRSYEEACSIISCSFSCDVNVYYCVGTAFVLPEDSEPSKVYPIPIWKFLIQFVVYC
ncbi:hypothetical protein BDL97_01G007000 [Sphagnum fallax]|nr:hypothetical protein BDL97_01G007000 [Sphagnum fallax]